MDELSLEIEEMEDIVAPGWGGFVAGAIGFAAGVGAAYLILT